MPEAAAHDSLVRLLFSLPEEATPFLRRLHRSERRREQNNEEGVRLGFEAENEFFAEETPGRLALSGPTWVAGNNCRGLVSCSRVGVDNAYTAAEHLLSGHSRARCLLICGFAGGLAADLLPGDLVIADSVVDQRSGQRYSADSALLCAAKSVRLSDMRIQRGTLVTTDRVLIHPDEKHLLAVRAESIAVDMETAGAVLAAQEMGVPWLAIRAITDGVNDALPLDFNALSDADGNIDRSRVVCAALARPWKIPALLRLGARSSRAAGNLAVFLEVFLQNLPG
jgi:adenosylhomocysteine nucleosidase